MKFAGSEFSTVVAGKTLWKNAALVLFARLCQREQDAGAPLLRIRPVDIPMSLKYGPSSGVRFVPERILRCRLADRLYYISFAERLAGRFAKGAPLVNRRGEETV
jgi:hypothetical protein